MIMNLTQVKKSEDIFKSLLNHKESNSFRDYNNKMLEKMQKEKSNSQQAKDNMELTF